MCARIRVYESVCGILTSLPHGRDLMMFKKSDGDGRMELSLEGGEGKGEVGRDKRNGVKKEIGWTTNVRGRGLRFPLSFRRALFLLAFVLTWLLPRPHSLTRHHISLRPPRPPRRSHRPCRGSRHRQMFRCQILGRESQS